MDAEFCYILEVKKLTSAFSLNLRHVFPDAEVFDEDVQDGLAQNRDEHLVDVSVTEAVLLQSALPP